MATAVASVQTHTISTGTTVAGSRQGFLSDGKTLILEQRSPAGRWIFLFWWYSLVLERPSPAAAPQRPSRGRLDFPSLIRHPAPIRVRHRAPIPQLRSECHPWHRDPRATHPAPRAPAPIRPAPIRVPPIRPRVPPIQRGAFPFSRREPKTLLFGGQREICIYTYMYVRIHVGLYVYLPTHLTSITTCLYTEAYMYMYIYIYTILILGACLGL